MKKYAYKLLLMVIIFIQITYTVYVFLYVKQGAHTDEVWTYGMANSYFQTFHGIKSGVMDSAQMGDLELYDTWFSGERLKNYISVQRGQRFAYDSVYYNNSYDVHPILFHIILHTICSFFPDTFSWWYGFAICLVCLVGTQIFLYLSTLKITHSEVTALTACLLYGGGKGALCTFTFIRQYSLLTMLCMIYTYLAVCCYENLRRQDKIQWRLIVLAAATAGLSFLTHYYGILYVGTFTAFFCLYLLCKHRFKAMFGWGGSMLTALGIFFVVYPPALKHIFSYSKAVQGFSPAVQIRIVLCYLFEYNYGFQIGWFPTAFWNITLPLVAAGIVAVLMLLFPFRKEKWFRGMIVFLKNKAVDFACWMRNANYMPCIVMGSCVVLYEVVAHSVDSYMNGDYSMRYTSLAVPLIAMVMVVGVTFVLSKMIRVKGVPQGLVLLAVCIALTRVALTTEYPYRFRVLGERVDILQETAGRNVLIIGRGINTYNSELTWFTPYLYEADHIYFTSAFAIREAVERGEFAQREIDYVFVDTGLFAVSDRDREQFLLKLRGEVSEDETPEDKTPEAEAEVEKEESGQRAINIEVVSGGEIADWDYCADLIYKIAQGDKYEILSLVVGQRAIYYLIRINGKA